MSELPNGWAEAELKELIANDGLISDGDWIESKDQDPSGGIRLIQLADLGDGEFKDKSDRYINSETFKRLNCTELQAGDILVARLPDPLGRACIFPSVPYRAITVVDVCIIRPGQQGVHNLWLKHIVNAQQVRDEIETNATGTTRKRIARKKLEEMSFPVPPLNEQKRIADKLDRLLARVDTAKTRLDKIPPLLKRLRQAILAAATTGKLTEEWREENPGSKVPTDEEISLAWESYYKQIGGRYKKAPTEEPGALGFDIPASWRATQMGMVFDVFVGATPSRKESEYWEGNIPWVSSSEVAFCRIKETKEKITEAGLSNTSTQLHPPGTVMLAMIGQGKTRGQPAILDIAACHNQNTAALRVNADIAVSEYLYFYFWGQYEKTREIGSGNNQQAMNKSMIQSMAFPLPPLEEQKEIVRRVEELFAIADRIEAQYRTARARVDRLTQSLLAKAFRGELVPQDPNDEPAAALLERIRAQCSAAPTRKKRKA